MKERKPSPIVSTIPLLLLVLLLAVVISVFGSDALGGASQIALITATAVTVCLSMGLYRVPWKRFEEAFEANIKGTTVSLLILLTIGALAGSWMVSGVVPTLIYYGIQIINPSIFLFCACVICAVVSVMTGSSWTTIATIGIALMGIGKAQGFADGWIAGAIISGAYFGDKISPLSDTTVLASSSSRTDLFTHIKYMMYTTVPTIVASLLIFLLAGFMMGDDVVSDVSTYTRG
ncbi:MAG: sodium:proton antiporter, partial [Bacteroidaceae bacterium]|nr:sodium:proton antiporter [Bacteroidaceae bacterium]MCF0187800.1 sodium:proton antiporter [Bacteroidaceae bacterium]